MGIGPVMGIKEGTYSMELWVGYVNNESWNTTSKLMTYCMVTNIIKDNNNKKREPELCSFSCNPLLLYRSLTDVVERGGSGKNNFP